MTEEVMCELEVSQGIGVVVPLEGEIKFYCAILAFPMYAMRAIQFVYDHN